MSVVRSKAEMTDELQTRKIKNFLREHGHTNESMSFAGKAIFARAVGGNYENTMKLIDRAHPDERAPDETGWDGTRLLYRR
jgi:hypothetical protein